MCSRSGICEGKERDGFDFFRGEVIGAGGLRFLQERTAGITSSRVLQQSLSTIRLDKARRQA
jgi:hypothetical protein